MPGNGEIGGGGRGSSVDVLFRVWKAKQGVLDSVHMWGYKDIDARKSITVMFPPGTTLPARPTEADGSTKVTVQLVADARREVKIGWE